MNDIRTPPRTPGGQLTPSSGSAPSSASAGASGATPAGAAAPLPASVPAEQAAMALMLEDASSGSSTSPDEASSSAEPVSNSSGAPWLPPPGTQMSADYLVALCSFLSSQSAENQFKPLQGQLDMKTRNQLEELEQANRNIAKSIENAKKMAAKRKAGGILGWIKRAVTIVALVVTVAAVTMVSGPAAPVVAAIAIACLLNALMGMASDISKAAGGPQLPGSMSAALQMGMVALCQEIMHDDDLARTVGILCSGVIGVASGAWLADPAFAGQLAMGAAVLGGTGEDKASMVAAWTTLAAVVAATVVLFLMARPPRGAAVNEARMQTKSLQAAKSVTGVTQAGLGVYEAKVNYDIQILQSMQLRFQAQDKLFSASITRLQSEWDAVMVELNRVVDSLSKTNSVLAQILNSDGENKAGILARMNGKATV